MNVHSNSLHYKTILNWIECQSTGIELGFENPGANEAEETL